ncbi:MAG TPA: hypothetical protein VGB89_01315 [Bacteroidota bacterium]
MASVNLGQGTFHLGRWVLVVLVFAQIDRDSFESTLIASPNLASGKTSFTDGELVLAMFSEYKYPPNFYHEDLSDWESLTLLPGCAQTLEEATANLFPNQKAPRVKFFFVRETERYFQFVKDRNPEEKTTDFYRFHKCSYLDILSLKRDGYRVRFNVRPLTSRNVKELIEYLWFVRFRQGAQLKVLSSNTEELESGFSHTLYVIKGVYQASEALNRRVGKKRIQVAQITLTRMDFFIDRNTGELTTTITPIREIKGQSEPLSVLR